MLSYKYLFDIALILMSTKLLGMLTRKFHMPQVVGALLAGLIMGPAMLNILNETNFIHQMAELGVIVLMFTAGLETDIQELKKTGKASFVIAIMGVVFPLAGGFIIATLFNKGDAMSTNMIMQNIFIGIILTATSVSITVETLKELGKLSTRAGNAILGAALIDDILGIIGLTVIISLADPSSTVSLWWVLAKIALFFICSIVIGFVVYKLFHKWVKRYDQDLRRFVIVSFVLCLLLSFAAEEFFGVADITGAFIAGLIVSNTERTKYIEARFNTMSYILLSPIFFASIGISIEVPKMTGSVIAFTSLLLIVAILTKVIGCGIGAKLCKYSNKESLRIGVGMVSRGEVALIVASKGAAVGLMSVAMFGPIVVMVVVTTIITPVLLKLVFRKNKNHPGGNEKVESELVNKYKQNIEFVEVVR